MDINDLVKYELRIRGNQVFAVNADASLSKSLPVEVTSLDRLCHYSQVKEIIDDYQNTILGLNERIEEKDAELRHKFDDLAAKDSEISLLKDKIKALRNQVHSSQKVIEKLKYEKADKGAKNSRLHATNNELRRKIKKMEEDHLKQVRTYPQGIDELMAKAVMPEPATP